MTGKPVTARLDTSVVDLAALMAAAGLRHVPGVDEEARCMGIVTQSDLVAAAAD